MKKTTVTAFTLVELLVVIAIVSVLAGMLLPALENAIDSSRSITCSNNLRQLGVGFEMYHDDNGRYPSGWNTASGLSEWPSNAKRWYALFEVYDLNVSRVTKTEVENGTVWNITCPEFVNNPVFNYNSGSIGYSYGMNTHNFGKVFVALPSKGVLVSESVYDMVSSEKYATQWNANCEITFIHQENANFLFYDGHTNSLMYEDIPYNHTNEPFWQGE